MFSKDITLEKIRNDLKELNKFWVVVYGGYVKDKTIRDIDIAIITKLTKFEDRNKNMEIWWDVIGKFSDLYDIKIFELMPLTMKISVINNYRVVFGNHLEISEYFYFYRKLWNDQKHRIEENMFKNYKEKIEAMERYKKQKEIKDKF